ncbi:type II toxin-antitoxin system RelE/ParE family toxin [Mucilaginibacter terrae]|uniref:type II toxin-antitoxin system RelE family toxin n=1 Tax=Mucilaginibacter terrae TaxID=1955052 RepID=UPI00363BFF47
MKAIDEIFDRLQLKPIPHGVKKLNGHQNLYRVRVSNYRIINSIKDAQLIIHVLKVGHRKDVCTNI